MKRVLIYILKQMHLCLCRYPVVFFVVALVLLFYVHLNSCASYVESWVGMLAPQVGASCLASCASTITQIFHRAASVQLCLWKHSFSTCCCATSRLS